MSLDSLRKLRAQTEEVITMELAQITQELACLERHCRSLEAQLHTDAAIYRLLAEQGLAIEAVLEWHGRMDSQQTALNQAHCQVGDLTAAWSRTQARLVEATQERKVLDRLAERNRKARHDEIRRREQLVMDESAQRYYSSTGEPST
jgi:flagellar export protein FliJ